MRQRDGLREELRDAESTGVTDVVGAGLLGGLGYFVVRRWIPGRGVWRGLLFGLFLLLVAGSRILDRDNPDFARFVSPSLAIALFAVLFPVYGLLVVWLADRWTRAAPKPPSVRLLATSGYAVVGVLSVAGLVSLASNLQGILAAPRTDSGRISSTLACGGGRECSTSPRRTRRPRRT